MFRIGDWVIYGHEGVCRVEDIGHPSVPGLDPKREYYCLKPYYHAGTIYAPVDGKIVMRPVISRSALDDLLPRLPELTVLDDVPQNGRQAGEYYRALLAEHSCERLLRLCKTLYAKQASLMHTRRSVSATDLRSWKAAEEMLYGEFGFVLGIPPAQVRGILEEQIGGQ